MADCRTCPQCKSDNTVAISETLRRCKDCLHTFEPRRYPTWIEIKEAQQKLGEKYR